MATAMTASTAIQFWTSNASLNTGKDVYFSSRRNTGSRSLTDMATSMLQNWARHVAPREERSGAPITVEVHLPGVALSDRDKFVLSLVRLSNATPWGVQPTRTVGNGTSTPFSLRETLLEYELLNSIDIEPDTYSLPTGESTFDFIFGDNRITCIFDDTYCHILADICGSPEDEVFEGDNLQPSIIGKHFRSLVERLKQPS